jgi:FdhE protein
MFGGARPLAPEVETAVAELRELAEQKPALGGLCSFLGAILPEVADGIAQEAPPSLTAEQAQMKLRGGIPLLRGESLAFDVPRFRRRWERICKALALPHENKSADALAEAVRRKRLEPAELTAFLLAGDRMGLGHRAAQLGVAPDLIATVLRLTMFPVLTRIASDLAPLRTVSWERGQCPTCGSAPLLGEYRGLEQNRFLRCGWCATGWELPRLLCPFCGTRDHRRLGYFFVEGEEGKHRASTCDECHGYVKMVSAFGALTAPRLLVADVATLPLDLAAADRGFFPPA